MSRGDARVDISCHEIVELVTDYLEGVLDPAATRDVEAHLATCEGCERYVEQMRQTVAALGRVPVESLGQDARKDLLAAFRTFHHRR